MINTALDYFLSDNNVTTDFNVKALTRAQKKELFACFIDDEDIQSMIQSAIEDVLWSRYLINKEYGEAS